MSQIVCCPACATLFRVAAEQLEMAHGWVRCGQCAKVFDAGLHLLPDLAGLASQGPLQQAVTTPQEPEAIHDVDVDVDVDFVRESRRRDFWQSRRVRAVLGLICVALFAGLMLQLVFRQKDALAAQDPRLAPLLQATCKVLGCEVRPLRRMGSIVIEQASFSKTGVDAYRLVFVFRNTGDAAVELPALEVTLTDSLDQALVRRVIMPAQFVPSAPFASSATPAALSTGTATLAAYADLAGAMSFKVADVGQQAALPLVQAGLLPVASYRILAFYP